MSRNRIMIIGCPEAGKTTFSNELGKRLKLLVVHLDVLNWRDNWTPVSRETFDELLLKEVSGERWIIDGNYGRTIPLRLKYADVVVYALVVRKNYRNKGIGKVLQQYALNYCSSLNFKEAYLYTDIENYYEKSGWKIIDEGYEYSGEKVKIFKHELI